MFLKNMRSLRGRKVFPYTQEADMKLCGESMGEKLLETG